MNKEHTSTGVSQMNTESEIYDGGEEYFEGYEFHESDLLYDDSEEAKLKSNMDPNIDPNLQPREGVFLAPEHHITNSSNHGGCGGFGTCDPQVRPLLLPHSCVQQVEGGREAREKFGQMQDVILLRTAMAAFPADDVDVSRALLAASPQLRYISQATVLWSLARCTKHRQTPLLLLCICKEVVNMRTMQVEPQYQLVLFFPTVESTNAAEEVGRLSAELPRLSQFTDMPVQVFYNHQRTADRWLRGWNHLTHIDFSGCTSLTEVGYGWLSGCTSLTSANFSGCASLKKVDGCWLAKCPSLTSANFSGCTSLKEVGHSCLAECASLTSANFSGCTSLKEVGHNWLMECTSLASANFSGCTTLTEVGQPPWWLKDYPSLTSADFSGCTSLTKLGPASLDISSCPSLTSADFSGCTSLTEIGPWCLKECPSLTSADFSGCTSLTEIGPWCLKECPSLTSADFSGCTSLTKVGVDWLSRCPSLTSADFSGCTSLTEVGHGWLAECPSLTSADFSGCTSLKEVRHCWLRDDALKNKLWTKQETTNHSGN